MTENKNNTNPISYCTAEKKIDNKTIKGKVIDIYYTKDRNYRNIIINDLNNKNQMKLSFNNDGILDTVDLFDKDNHKFAVIELSKTYNPNIQKLISENNIEEIIELFVENCETISFNDNNKLNFTYSLNEIKDEDIKIEHYFNENGKIRSKKMEYKDGNTVECIFNLENQNIDRIIIENEVGDFDVIKGEELTGLLNNITVNKSKINKIVETTPDVKLKQLFGLIDEDIINKINEENKQKRLEKKLDIIEKINNKFQQSIQTNKSVVLPL